MLINITSITQMPDPWDTADKDVVQCNGITYQNIRNEFWLPVGVGSPVFTTGTLPPTTGLLEGVSVAVSDFGGNSARVVNGQWRFELPFRTTWEGRPAIGLVPVGTELQVTDYANQKFISDGSAWRPAQGRVLIAQKSADGSAALATISGFVSGEFAITKPVIKAGMIPANSKIRVEGMVAKAGTVGTFVPAVYFGKTNSMSTDPAIGSVGVTITSDGTGTRWDMLACFGTSTSMFLRSGNTSPQGQSTGNIYSHATNVDTAVDMFITFAIVSGNAADTFALKSYSVWLEA